MDRPGRTAWRALVAVCALVVVAACSDAGDLSMINDDADPVTVRTGDEVVEVDGSGGAVLLDYGCTPGDVTVELPTGRAVVLDGPVCPDEEIVVRDGEVTLEPAETGAWP